VKVYCVGGSRAEIAQLRNFCGERGWDLQPMRGFGRPPREYPVKKVVNGYRELGKIRAVAKKLGLNPGAVFRILKEAGMLEDEVIKRSKNG